MNRFVNSCGLLCVILRCSSAATTATPESNDLTYSAGGCIGKTLVMGCPAGYTINITSFLCNKGVQIICYMQLEEKKNYCAERNCSGICREPFPQSTARQLQCKQFCSQCNKICTRDNMSLRVPSLREHFESTCGKGNNCNYTVPCNDYYKDTAVNLAKSDSYPTNNFDKDTLSNFNYCEANFTCTPIPPTTEPPTTARYTSTSSSSTNTSAARDTAHASTTPGFRSPITTFSPSVSDNTGNTCAGDGCPDQQTIIIAAAAAGGGLVVLLIIILTIWIVKTGRCDKKCKIGDKGSSDKYISPEISEMKNGKHSYQVENDYQQDHEIAGRANDNRGYSKTPPADTRTENGVPPTADVYAPVVKPKKPKKPDKPTLDKPVLGKPRDENDMYCEENDAYNM